MKKTFFVMMAAVVGIFILASCGEEPGPQKRPANIPAGPLESQCIVKQQLTIGANASQTMTMEVKLDDFKVISALGQDAYKWIGSIKFLTGKIFDFKLNVRESGASIKKLTLRCSGAEYSFGPSDLPYSPAFEPSQLTFFENICKQLLATGTAKIDYTIENGAVVIKNDESKAELSFVAEFKMKDELK